MGKLRFRRLAVPEWEAFDQGTPAPTFFARPAWALAVGRCFPQLEPYPMACELADSTLAVVPLTRVVNRLGWPMYHGMPFDGYTAVLTANGLLESERSREVVDALLDCGDEVLLNLWPFHEVAAGSANVHVKAETSALRLGGSLETARQAIASKSRRMAGQAERKGATCTMEGGVGAASVYYELLQAAATERWGRSAPTISEAFLNAVVTLGGPQVEIWIVRHEGEAVSGGVALYGSSEVSLWTTATKPGLEILRPHNLLHASIMEHAGVRGIEWYNLNSSSGLEGVLRFKRALGAELFPYEIVGRRSLRYRLVRALRDKTRSGT